MYNKTAYIPILSAERKDGYFEYTAEQDCSPIEIPKNTEQQIEKLNASLDNLSKAEPNRNKNKTDNLT